MRRPGSNECLQDKPRNRHFAEWRFLPLIRTVTVNPKIWNVIVIGMSLTSLPEDTVTNRLPYSFGALGGHKTIFILPKTAHFVNSRRTSPQAQKKPPLPGEVARRSRDGEVVPSAEAHSRRRQPLRHAPRASSPKRGALKKSPLQGEAFFILANHSRA